jgi:class 3 adenylate cyclase/tetratricopeptide (TPR) repeat protein
MTCPRCHAECPPTARFCAECGTRLRHLCPQCGAQAPPAAKFCGECGTALAAAAASPDPPPAADLEAQFRSLQQTLPAAFRDQLLAPAEGENRVVTVLFADMSGSVATMRDLHPEEGADLVNSLLRAIVDVLLKYEGRVDRFLGDGVLAVFGAPTAHESDPERAILTALEIRDAARQQGMEITAGINTGEVYVGRMGSERHEELTVMGPVVNLASRLQGYAEPGQILVGEATYHQTRRAFAFTPLSIPLKGFADPVVAHSVEGPLVRPEKARGIEGLRAELIGRDEELSKLRDALSDVCRGHGRIVSLVGEAGVGKSRLVAELKAGCRVSGVGCRKTRSHDTRRPRAAPLHSDTLLWLEGRCLELGTSASYWLFVDLFRDYFAQRGEDERGHAEQLAAALQEIVAQGGLTQERVEEMGPLIGNLLSLRFGDDWDERLKHASPEQIRHQTFLAVHDFFVALARRHPVVLVLEDLHWADTLSLDLISLLMEALRLAPLLLLCVYRPEQEHKCWHLATIAARKCPERFTEVRLHELTPQQGRRLVESLLTIENLPEPVKDLILEKARGNPFFVEEVIRSLIGSGMVFREGDTWRAKEGIETIAVPESVRSVILTRVDRLDRDLKRVLQNAAVIGRLFRQRLLEHTLGNAAQLERDLWELEEKAFIYQERAVPEAEYSFQHVLTQETVYENILRRRRAAFHQQVAEAIEALYADGLAEQYEQLAYHYERCTVDEKAIEYLLKAGEKARRAYLNDEAIQYFQRALQRLERSGLAETRKRWRLEAAKGLGEVYSGVGRAREAEAPFRQALALAKEMELPPPERARIAYWLGRTVWWLGDYKEGVRLGEEYLALLGAETETVEAAITIENLAMCYLYTNDRVRYRELTYRLRPFLDRLPYSEELRPAFVRLNHVCAYEDGNVEEARRWLDLLEQRVMRHAELRGLAIVPFMRAQLRVRQGDLHGSLPYLESALDRFARIGDTGRWSWCLHWIERAYLELGELDAAEECGSRSYGPTVELRNKENLADWRARAGTIALCRGACERAAVSFEEAVRVRREIGHRLAGLQVCLARTYLMGGEPQHALRILREALSSDENRSVTTLPPGFLATLEDVLADPDCLRAECLRLQNEHPGLSDPYFLQWFLEPVAPCPLPSERMHDAFLSGPSAEWRWLDPLADCTFTFGNGLAIRAANGRDMAQLNLSAPRLLRPVSGRFVSQTSCLPALQDRPATGGLLLWKDERNYLCLDRGQWGPYEVSFHGCIDRQGLQFGRGRLPAERVFLRLERISSRVNALCSADGESWFTVGHVEFPVEDPLQVGVHAIGMIDRTVYPGAYPEGTAIRFESVTLWGGNPR